MKRELKLTTFSIFSASISRCKRNPDEKGTETIPIGKYISGTLAGVAKGIPMKRELKRIPRMFLRSSGIALQKESR